MVITKTAVIGLKSKKKQSKVEEPKKPSGDREGVRKGLSLWLCAGLALVTFIVFLPVLQNDFVNYDDPDYVTANSHVLSGLSLENIGWAFTSGHASNWHPLTWISHMLDCSLFGQRASAHHLVSLLFHVANTA